MVKIIFNSGEILECDNVNKIYIENDEIPIETEGMSFCGFQKVMEDKNDDK